MAHERFVARQREAHMHARAAPITGPLSCPDCQIRIRAGRTCAMRSSSVSQCSTRYVKVGCAPHLMQRLWTRFVDWFNSSVDVPGRATICTPESSSVSPAPSPVSTIQCG
eukprot:1276402-Prymnesium_polylepis.1